MKHPYHLSDALLSFTNTVCSRPDFHQRGINGRNSWLPRTTGKKRPWCAVIRLRVIRFWTSRYENNPFAWFFTTTNVPNWWRLPIGTFSLKGQQRMILTNSYLRYPIIFDARPHCMKSAIGSRHVFCRAELESGWNLLWWLIEWTELSENEDL